MIRVTFELRPDDTLTPEKVQAIADAARAAGLTPEQWVKQAVLRQVRDAGPQVLPMATPEPQSAA